MIRALVILLIALHVQAPPATRPAEPGDGDETSLEEVVIGGETFRLELAVDPETRARGLMERDEIADDGGMLFVYPRAGLRSFWMAHCTIDIDILFLDARGRIVSGYTMVAEPPQTAGEPDYAYEGRLRRYWSRRPAQYAIELKSGTVERLEVELGTRLELDLPRLRKLAS